MLADRGISKSPPRHPGSSSGACQVPRVDSGVTVPSSAKAATHPHVFEAVQPRQHARTDGSQGIQGALYVPVSLRIAVQSSPAQMLLILPWLRR